MKPRRSILSVPGHVEKMHRKAYDSYADVVMLDLEDSVPVDEKMGARQKVIDSLGGFDWSSKAVTVRINSLETPFGYRDLLEISESAGSLLDTIVIPKVNDPGDIFFVDRLLNGVESAFKYSHRVGIEASIETAAGLENISAIAAASNRIKTLVFGIADYTASVGAKLVSVSGHGENETDIYPGHRWHFPLSRLVMAAKAHGLMAIDAPYGNFKDADGLKKSAVMSCALGCNGKWAIHPDQIAVINKVYSPTSDDIENARRVIQAFEKARKEGKGAVALDGKMVDHATVQLAHQLFSQAKHLKMV